MILYKYWPSISCLFYWPTITLAYPTGSVHMQKRLAHALYSSMFQKVIEIGTTKSDRKNNKCHKWNEMCLHLPTHKVLSLSDNSYPFLHSHTSDPLLGIRTQPPLVQVSPVWHWRSAEKDKLKIMFKYADKGFSYYCNVLGKIIWPVNALNITHAIMCRLQCTMQFFSHTSMQYLSNIVLGCNLVVNQFWAPRCKTFVIYTFLQPSPVEVDDFELLLHPITCTLKILISRLNNTMTILQEKNALVAIKTNVQPLH